MTSRDLQDAELGMAWWNRCSEIERQYWLDRADTAVPADAWAFFKLNVARDDGREVSTP